MSNAVIIPAPPSKSLSHRALIAAALAKGQSRLSNVLESEDIARTKEILASIGASVIKKEQGEYLVVGLGGKIVSPHSEPLACFVGESGTSCRLLTAVLAAGCGLFRIHGAGRMHKRPLAPLGDALEVLGAKITYEEQRGCPPLLLKAACLKRDTPAGPLDISAEESSQYLSGLLLAAPLTNGLYVRLTGQRITSWPYVLLTLKVLEDFGVTVQVETLQGDMWLPTDWRLLRAPQPGQTRFHIPAATYKAADYTVEGDWSSASYFLAAGAVGPKPVMVSGLKPDSLQGDAALLSILHRMGAHIAPSGKGVIVCPAPLRGIEADLGQNPDLAPTVAALAAHAFGPTTINGVARLRLKESDRLEALTIELTKTGARIEQREDSLRIFPPDDGLQPLAAGTFSTHGDHRLAMSLPLLGLPDLRGSQGFAVPLDDPKCVEKSFPCFWSLWNQIAG